MSSTATAATAPDSEEFSGEIKVASRIIDYISSGLYHSPAACLKELINNSYDADASRVNVYVKPDADRIIIEDDGTGMSRTEFVRHFARIAESHKRDTSAVTAKGRPKIGKIGIGFIAANEICEVMEIYSTKAGSSELLYVSIDFSELRKPLEDRRREGGDIAKADYHGRVTDTDPESHYTRIFLTRVRGEAQEILAGATSQDSPGPKRSLYGLSAPSIRRALTDPTLKSWKDFDTYSETMLQVGLNIPVPYHPEWLPDAFKPEVEEIEEHVLQLGFEVFYDGTELRKPIVFDPPSRALLRKFTFEGERVAASGYLFAQHTTIRPRDLHGLLVRIRNAAVGEYDPSFWGFSPSEYSLLQRWVSVEIWADDRLEEAMNIDRRTLREAHPAYVELRAAIHKELRKVLSDTRSILYQAGNTERREQKAQTTIKALDRVARERVESVSPRAAAELAASWDVNSDPKAQKQLLKKYTVTEIYTSVVDAAKGVITAEQLEELLRRLTRRFGR